MTDRLAVGGDALAANVVLFGRVLRRAGLGADADQTRRFAQVLALLGVERRGDVKAAGRAVFVRRPEERATYDAAFDLFWRRSALVGGASAALPRIRQQREPRAGGADIGFGAEAPPGVDVTDVVDRTAPTGARRSAPGCRSGPPGGGGRAGAASGSPRARCCAARSAPGARRSTGAG